MFSSLCYEHWISNTSEDLSYPCLLLVPRYLCEASTLLRFPVWKCSYGVRRSVNMTAILSLYDISFNLLIFILPSKPLYSAFFSNSFSSSSDSSIFTKTNFYCSWLIKLATLRVTVFILQYGQTILYLTSMGFWFYKVLMSSAQFRHS